jgi:Xaa-Pro dipeptidase
MTGVPGLSFEGCRTRQGRLRDVIRARDLAGALIAGRRHVHYFTGYWTRELYAPLLLIERDGPSTLVAPPAPDSPGPAAADEVLFYEAARQGTLVDDQPGAAVQALVGRLAGIPALGCDRIPWPDLAGRHPFVDLTNELLALRRCKDEDEVRLQRFAIDALETAYDRVRRMLAPGVTEVDVFSTVHGVVAGRVGEAIGEIGNDFQIGSLGSAPRRRAACEGEVAILDLSVTVRGYASDMCRSFVVGGRPSAAQQEAHGRVLEALAEVDRTARPGVSCRDLDAAARAHLDGYRGWSFRHHLGHGIELANHEAPRLNQDWDDVLRPGDTVAVEPGLYGDDLRAGIRVEEIYYVTDVGVERLTTFPTDLA